MNKNVVMALSGGMDSATVLGYLISKGYKVDCLSFQYGSKHGEYESVSAVKVAKHYGVSLTEISLINVMDIFESNLLKSGGEIPEGHYTDSTMAQTVVPGRNMIFLSILAGRAVTLNADEIAIGIHQGDHVIYADCRTEFYKAMDSAIYLGTDNKVSIVAPFIDTDKTGILTWGLENGVPYHLTRTCYKDQEFSCGKCGSCVERLEAFDKMNMDDPIEYEEN